MAAKSTPTPNTNPEVDVIVAHLAEEEAKVAEHQGRADQLKARLRELLELGAYQVGDVRLTLGANKRLDDKRFRAAFPPENFPQFYEDAPPKVRSAAISDDLKAQYSAYGDAKVSIK